MTLAQLLVDAIADRDKRIAELEKELAEIRSLLNKQEDKSCLVTDYPSNEYECAP